MLEPFGPADPPCMRMGYVIPCSIQGIGRFKTMTTSFHRRAGVFVAGVLGIDGILHAYWTTGARWPASDSQTLSRLVLGAENVPFTPPVVGPLAALLLTGSVMALARSGNLGRLGDAVPRRLLQLGMCAITAGVLARSLLGIVFIATRDTGSAFYWLNLLVYTPLCLAMLAASLLILKPSQAPVVTPGPP
ncbi:MAG TPA: DUF3995 domain-containing protein, partial [Oleiagrimonas sp.]|nr:DUF3995 domain-containing protein [Oleiagrimonas sp.]